MPDPPEAILLQASRSDWLRRPEAMLPTADPYLPTLKSVFRSDTEPERTSEHGLRTGAAWGRRSDYGRRAARGPAGRGAASSRSMSATSAGSSGFVRGA